MVGHTLRVPEIALYGLKLAHDVGGKRAGGFQLEHYRICDAHGIAQGYTLVDERLLQLLRLFLESVAVRLVGGLAGRLNRPLLSRDASSRREPVVSGGKVRNLSALVDKAFEILAVLLDDFVLDVLVLLCAFLGGFEFSDKGVDVAHLLVQFLRKTCRRVPCLPHLLCVLRSAVAQRLDRENDGGNYGEDKPEGIGLYNGVEKPHGMSGRAHALRESDNGDTPQDCRGTVSCQNGLADTEDGVPRHSRGLDQKKPTVISGYDGNDIGDGLTMLDDERYKNIQHTEESRR